MDNLRWGRTSGDTVAEVAAWSDYIFIVYENGSGSVTTRIVCSGFPAIVLMDDCYPDRTAAKAACEQWRGENESAVSFARV